MIGAVGIGVGVAEAQAARRRARRIGLRRMEYRVCKCVGA
jgi:hypothetical protein